MKFIKDTPLGEDLFEGKSQDNIANSIVTQLKNQGNRTIGIDGEWGSGKSNLVKIVERKLPANEFIFFEYDVWGHQQDLQRRTILEELVDFLLTRKILKNSSRWTKKVKELTGTLIETTTKSVPKVSLAILFSFLVLILLPTFSPLADFLQEKYKIDKIWILLLPFFILVIIAIVSFIITWGKEKRFLASFPITLANIVSVYKDEQTESSCAEFTHECNPSITDFSNFLREISLELRDKKLVFVFDNMDRLPEEKVRELWASIHILFADKENCGYGNVHAIIPFDRKHVQNTFHDDKGKSFGDDYINKTFDIVYRVSPPILSDWKDFFGLKWQEAFDESIENNDEFDRVLQAFDLLNKGLTPRSIIVFINELISMKMISQNSIPIRYIALFVLKRKQILANPINQIIERSFLKNLRFIYQHDNEFTKNLTAIVYQIDPERAVQVVYSQQLKDALENADIQTVNLISKTPEFIKILERLLPDLVNLENAIVALDNVGSVNFNSKQMRIWSDLYAKYESAKLTIAEDSLRPYQKALLKNITSKEKCAHRIIEEINSSEKFNGLSYYNILKELERLLSAEEIDLAKHIPVKSIIPESFLDILKHAKKEYTVAKVECDVNKLDEFLAAKSVGELNDIKQIQYADWSVKLKLKKFMQKLSEFSAQNATNKEILPTIIEIMQELSETPIPHKLQDRQVYDLFSGQTQKDSFYYALLAMRIAKGQNFDANLRVRFDEAMKDTTKEHIVAVAKVIEKHIIFGDILLNLESMKQYPLYIELCKHLIENVYTPHRANIPSILEKLAIIIKAGGFEAELLLNCLSDWALPDIKDKDIEKVFDYQNLIILASSKTTMGKKSQKIVREYLNRLSGEEWEKRLSDFQTFGVYEAFEVNFAWNSKTSEALKNILLRMAKNELQLGDRDEWEDLIEHMEEKGKGFISIFKSVRDCFINNASITLEQFKFFGKWLFKYARLEEKRESLRTIIPIEVFRDPPCVTVLLENKDALLQIIKNAGDEATDVKDCLIEQVKNDPTTELKIIFDLLHLEIPKEDKDDDNTPSGKN